MKAVRIHQHGGPEVLKLEEIPDPPDPRQDEIRIEVKFASINHLDIWCRRGMPGIKIPMPHILGCDASGIVSRIGQGVSGFEVGDRVLVNPGSSCGHCEFCSSGEGSLCLQYKIFGEHKPGTNCKYITAQSHSVYKVSEEISLEVAAAAPLTYLTAWRMMMTKAQVKPGDTVFVWAAGAGVGIACLQLSKLMGASVITSSTSDQKCERLRGLGADFAINSAKQSVSDEVKRITKKRGVDIVVDYIGRETWGTSLNISRRGGKIVTCGATSGYDPAEDLRHIYYRQLSILGSTMGSEKEFKDVISLVLAGKLKPVVDRVFELKDASLAHSEIENRRVFGKLLLRVE